MATDDSLTRTAPPSPSEVIRGLRENPTGLPRRTEPRPDAAATAAGEDAHEFEPLPKSSDDYVAFGRPGNKPLVSLILMLKNGSFEGFAYAGLERVGLTPAEEIGGGNELVLRFAGSTVTEVRIKGRNLVKLYAYLGQHRTPWLRELPSGRDFEPTGTAVITSIEVVDLTAG